MSQSSARGRLAGDRARSSAGIIPPAASTAAVPATFPRKARRGDGADDELVMHGSEKKWEREVCHLLPVL
jgi:hypothetical protein